jgi:hypothetical protein
MMVFYSKAILGLRSGEKAMVISILSGTAWFFQWESNILVLESEFIYFSIVSNPYNCELIKSFKIYFKLINKAPEQEIKMVLA